MEKYKDQEENGTNLGGGFMGTKVKEANVRIVSGFASFHQHYIEGSGSLFCIGASRGCVECKENKRPAFRAFVWVIDRDEPDEDKKLKIMPCGWTVHMQIVRLSKGTMTQFEKVEEKPLKMMDDTLDTPEYTFENMPGYDIKILRTGEMLETRYEVVPMKPSDLNEEELELIEKGVTDLDRIVVGMEKKVLSPEKAVGEGADGSLDEVEYPKEVTSGEIPF